MRAGGIAWFARHEALLAWRDWMHLASGHGRRRTTTLLLIGVVAAVFLHLIAIATLHPDPNLAEAPTTQTLVIVTVVVILSWSLMLSQALEAVTRTFYARGDLDLILSSPAASSRLFAVRIMAMVVILASTVLVLAAPFINTLAWRGGASWLALYPATIGLAMIAVALAILMTAGLFQTIGARRTRLFAQIAAAVIGAIFAIVLQFAALLYIGTPNRMAFLESETVLALAPAVDSPLWGLTEAMLGQTLPLAILLGVASLSLGLVIVVFAPRFEAIVLACSSVAQQPARGGGSVMAFRNTSPAQSLRRKEWTLLRRDPWLVSQTLVQIMYLLPAAYLLWRAFNVGIDAVTILVPLLVTSAGQFAGGLAWLAISGEDAPDLIRTAPVRGTSILRATFEAVTGATFLVFGPIMVALALLSPRAGLSGVAGLLAAAVTATAIQHWYRLQAHRGHIRRRQTASRFTTYIEALASISWAATAAMATAGSWLAGVPAVIGCLTVLVAWVISPSRASGSRRGARPSSRQKTA